MATIIRVSSREICEMKEMEKDIEKEKRIDTLDGLLDSIKFVLYYFILLVAVSFIFTILLKNYQLFTSFVSLVLPLRQSWYHISFPAERQTNRFGHCACLYLTPILEFINVNSSFEM